MCLRSCNDRRATAHGQCFPNFQKRAFYCHIDVNLSHSLVVVAKCLVVAYIDVMARESQSLDAVDKNLFSTIRTFAFHVFMLQKYNDRQKSSKKEKKQCFFSNKNATTSPNPTMTFHI